MIDRRLAMQLEDRPLFQWLGYSALVVLVGLILTLGDTPIPAKAAGLVVLSIGIGAAVQTIRVVTRIELGTLTIRNHVRSTTIPLASVRSIRATTMLELNLMRSYGRLVITDADGRDWPLVGSTGEGPQIILLFIHDVLEVAPDVEIHVDLALFPHTRSRDRGTEQIGMPALPPPAPARPDPDEELRRRREAGRADLDRLRRELDAIRDATRS